VSLFWRVFAMNAALLLVAVLVLVLSPATVSFPVALTEALILLAGVGTLIIFNFLLLRRVFEPLRRLTAFMRDVDPLRPGARAPTRHADPEVRELTSAFNEMIARLETERRESARRALAAQEAERLRIAHDLHDEVGQSLTAAMLQIEHSGRRRGSGAEELAAAREEVRSALDEVRRIAARLRPEALDLGLPAAMRSLINDFERRSGLTVERDIETVGAVSPEAEVVAYRVAQEALTNIVRHADATVVQLGLRADDSVLALEVFDDGRGFNGAGSVEGAGLRGMRERAVLAGAELTVQSRPGAGTRVRLVFGRDGR
jgi:two-component system, NarL family, sensor histidine kinase UhpB